MLHRVDSFFARQMRAISLSGKWGKVAAHVGPKGAEDQRQSPGQIWRMSGRGAGVVRGCCPSVGLGGAGVGREVLRCELRLEELARPSLEIWAPSPPTLDLLLRHGWAGVFSL